MSDDSVTPAPSTEASVEVVTNWRDTLPEGIRENASLADVKDIAGLAQRFIDTKAMVGNSMRMPSDDAGQEDVTAFANKILENNALGLMRKPDSEDPTSYDSIYNTLGRPEDTSGYEAGEGVDAQMFGAMAAKAHELGLSKKQYEELSLAHSALATEQMNEVNGKRQQGIDQLQGEWAGAYNEKVGRAGQMIKQFGGHEGLEAALANNQIDAATLRLLDTIATQIGAEGSPLAGQLDQMTQQTSDELKQRRDEITNRLIKETLTVQQRTDLQNKMISLSEKISAYG